MVSFSGKEVLLEPCSRRGISGIVAEAERKAQLVSLAESGLTVFDFEIKTEERNNLKGENQYACKEDLSDLPESGVIEC